jgi:hypothetical protein
VLSAHADETMTARAGERMVNAWYLAALWCANTAGSLRSRFTKLTPEQKEQLKAMGVDVDALGGDKA